MDTFGSRVRKLRKAKRLTQKELGLLVGVSGPMVTQWEADQSYPKKDNADRLCAILETNWNWLKTGLGESGSNTDAPPPVISQAEGKPPVMLLQKSSIAAYLSDDPGVSKGYASEKSGLIRDAAGAGPRTFAYAETSDGMSPRIEPGDTVYIDPDQSECKPGREIWLFRVGNGYALGAVTETPRGLMLRFDNQAPGWEPMPVQPGDCAGKLVAFVPSWLG